VTLAISYDAAHAVKRLVQDRLGQPAWLARVGLGQGVTGYFVRIQVRPGYTVPVPLPQTVEVRGAGGALVSVQVKLEQVGNPRPGYGRQVLQGMGAAAVVVTSCPQCAKLIDGSCEVCDDDDEDDQKHPSCQGCKKGIYTAPPTPWYQNEYVWTIGGTVLATVLGAYLITRYRLHG
jgi:hypothetical protein